MSIIGDMLEESHIRDLERVWKIIDRLINKEAPTTCSVCGSPLSPSRSHYTYDVLVCPREGCIEDRWNATTGKWYTRKDLRQDIASEFVNVRMNPPSVSSRTPRQQKIDWILTHFKRIDPRVTREMVKEVLDEVEKVSSNETV